MESLNISNEFKSFTATSLLHSTKQTKIFLITKGFGICLLTLNKN